MTPTPTSTEELTATAIRVLCREIGLANTARFLREIRPGKGDYTKERDELFGDMSMDDIIAEIKRLRETQPSPAQKSSE